MRDILELFGGQANHLVGNIHTVNLAEVPAHGPHQPARTASDLESAALIYRSRRKPREIPLPVRLVTSAAVARNSCSCLTAPPERDVEVSVLPRAAIPVGPHLLVYVHVPW